MKVDDILDKYNVLIGTAEKAFDEMQSKYQQLVECRIQCSDCCHAVFGVFLIEAFVIQQAVAKLSAQECSHLLENVRESEKKLAEVRERLASQNRDGEIDGEILSMERAPCPLLGQEQECILYQSRPLTCRVYGVPTSIKGKPHVCNKAGFEDGQAYPCYDMDRANKVLYLLSKELVERAGAQNPEVAALLFSVSKVLTTPFQDLMNTEIP